MKTFIIFIPLFFFFSFLSFSQMTNSSLPEVIPRSPNAAALEKFGSYPVSYNNGTVGISVDLYQLKLDQNIDLNISLNYHSSGIKVEDVSSWVGTGWALSAGGCITREVRGIRDEDYAGFYNYSLRNKGHTLPQDIQERTHLDILNQIRDKVRDSEPDIFSYNFNGRSGKFFVDNYGEFQTMPHADIKFNKNPLSGSGFSSWELIDENGYKYTFAFIETTETYIDIYVTAWWLTSILSPEGKTLVTFEYKDNQSQHPAITRKTYTAHLGPWALPAGYTYIVGEKSTQSYSSFSGADLKKIDIPGKGYFIFSATTERTDQNWQLLDVIEYFDAKNKIKYKYLFKYIHENYRPYLSEIIRADDIEEIKYRKFTYNPNLPMRSSYSQDLWGYYNGESNSSLYPYVAEFKGCPGVNYNEAKRSPSQKVVAGTIKEIIYPTGGKTVFKFENNYVFAINSSYNVENKTHWHYHEGYGEQTSTFKTSGGTIENGTVRVVLHSVGIYDSEIKLINTDTGQLIRSWYPRLSGGDVPEVGDDGSVQFEMKFSNILIDEGNYKWVSKIIHNYPEYDNVVPPPVTAYHTYRVKVKTDETKQQMVGGLRIAEIINYDNNDNITGHTRYKYLNSEGVCSGYSAPNPVFLREYGVSVCHTGFVGISHYVAELNEVNLSRFTGSPVQYTYVIEENLEDQKVKFRTDYTYNRREFYNGPVTSQRRLGSAWNGVPYSVNDYEEGRLTSKVSYKHDGSKLVPIETEKYAWTIDNRTVTSIDALALSEYFGIQDCYNVTNHDRYNFGFYNLKAAKVYLREKQTKRITSDGEILTTVSYHYDNPDYMQLTKIVTTDSQGKTIETSNRYCFDESTTISDKMKAKNMVAQPLEIIKTVSGSQTEKLKVTYETFNEEAILEPKHIEKQTTSDAGFSGVTYHKYDSYGNPLHLSQNDAIEVFYLWSYNGKYPIAEIRNATYAKVEAAVKAVFGVKSIEELSALASVDANKVSYLSNDKNLVDSHVTIYTYDSTGNMLTATDPSGVTTFYVYDSFDRLIETYIKENGIKKTLSIYKYKYRN